MQSDEVNVAVISDAVSEGVMAMKLSTMSVPLAATENVCFAISASDSSFQLVPPFIEKVFTPNSYDRLCSFYHHLYPHVELIEIPRFFQCMKKVVMFGQPITSVMSVSEVSNVVMASWPGKGEDISASNRQRIGKIQYFLQHTVSCRVMGKVNTVEHILAFINWY